MKKITALILSLIIIVCAFISVYGCTKEKNSNKSSAVIYNKKESLTVEASKPLLTNANSKDTDTLKDQLSVMLVNEYDCKSKNALEDASEFVFNRIDSALYCYYFGNSGFESIFSDDRMDPLNKTMPNSKYYKMKAENVDWIIHNIFNIDKNNVPTNSEERYNYEGYYYECNVEQAGLLDSVFEISDLKNQPDGTYKFNATEYLVCDGNKEYNSTFEINAGLKELNGKRLWTFYSIKKVMTIKDAYIEIIAKYNENELGYCPTYTIYDIDKDGTYELLVREGNCEATYKFLIYSYVNGKVKLLGKTSGSHSGLYGIDNENGIYIQSCIMGYEKIDKLYIENGKTEIKSIKKEHYVGDGALYTNLDNYLDEIPVTDYSLLNNLK